MGNGFPVSALATKRSIAMQFGNGMEYFNTVMNFFALNAVDRRKKEVTFSLEEILCHALLFWAFLKLSKTNV